MKNISLGICGILVLWTSLGWAQGTTVNATTEGVPRLNLYPGLEVVNVDGNNVLIPEGAEIKKEGNRIYMEELGGFTGRKVTELEEKISSLEKSNLKLSAEIEELKQEIKDLKSPPPETPPPAQEEVFPAQFLQ